MLCYAKSLQSCPTLCDPIDSSHQAPRPWDSPGKNTGVGCHFLLQCMKVKSEREVAQSCPILSDPMDRSLPGSSIHGIFQARVLEWVPLPSPQEDSVSGIKSPRECQCCENTANSGILNQCSGRVTWGSSWSVDSWAFSPLNSCGRRWCPGFCSLTSTSGGSDATGSLDHTWKNTTLAAWMNSWIFWFR